MADQRTRRFLRNQWRRLRPYCPSAVLPAAYFVLGFPSYVRSLLRPRRPRLQEQWAGADDIAQARRVAVFVHFDRAGEVHDWLIHYLSELKGAGYAIIFVSNAPRLSENSVAKVRPHCAIVARRDNLGSDFGAYRDGIGLVPALDNLESLLLANDSVFGPFHPLAATLARMSPDQAPVWGITDSLEGGFHLQSYFLLFHRAALSSPAFGRFWRGHRDVQSRYWTILKYEIGITHSLRKAGLQCRALFHFREAEAIARKNPARAGRRVPRNPMHDMWDVLIGELGCPFIKRDLLRSRPPMDPDLGRWRALVESVSGYDTSLIAGERPSPPEGAGA